LFEWLQSLPADYGYSALFLALFINNFGIPFPGTTILLASGLLVNRGIFSFWPTVAVATGACFLGSFCGYWLGHRYGLPFLKKVRWLHLTHQRIKHLEKFFKRFGPMGVFFARFVSVLHPVIGLMAGTGQTPRGPFLFYNLTGSLAYALLYTFAGDWFGAKWGLHHVWLIHMTSYVLILLVVLLILAFFWRYSIHSFLGFVYFRKKR